MNNEEFAVNLAQFSQLEQLISINEKFDAASNSSVSSLAGLLGQEVTLSRETVSLSEDSASALRVNAPSGAQSLTISLKNKEGGVVDSIEVPVTQSGVQRIDLKGLTRLEGEFGIAVSANTGSGAQVPIQASVVGTVTGFIPGSEPTLILDGGEEVQLKDIKRVDVPIDTNSNSQQK
jgi:flagellar basal-body rod modification protein FlgD